ncbi:hypothetical protein Pmani_016636 [Petrolisthes manimaculis]|uniref:Uncharacterized protein n=1 Tax=Petrolisthes manimaculis TaxID=1843537 RepID=A0AAE1PPN2_9EUCA|nr:hypothetical protein Pmani_016636 [Petrolisthes manimaculis]
MRERVGLAIDCQHMFDRKTSPWEANLWKEDELDSFYLNLESVDRLYHINHEDGDEFSGDDFELVVRVEYKKHHLFVELSAGCRFTDFECRGGGDIFVSFNANLFTRTIMTKVPSEERLYESLMEDGHLVEGKRVEEEDGGRNIVTAAALVMGTWHQHPPKLKLLCHQAVHHNRHQLTFYTDVLPKALVASITEFIVIKDTIDYYDSWD